MTVSEKTLVGDAVTEKTVKVPRLLGDPVELADELWEEIWHEADERLACGEQPSLVVCP